MQSEGTLIQVGAALIDTVKRTVSVEGRTETLSDLTWKLLDALIRASPDSVSYSEIAQSVWGQAHVSDETIAQRVRQLRLAFGDDVKAPEFIRTLRGSGYQLIPPVTAVASKEPNLPNAKTNMKRLPHIFTVLALLVIAALVFYFEPWKSVDPLPASQNTQVQELLDRAYDYSNRGQDQANDYAVDLYEQALKAEPNNVTALIGLSVSLSHRPSKYEQSTDWANRAAELADKAMSLEPENGEAWAARGFADDARGRVSGAIRFYQRALELNPENRNMRPNIAFLLRMQGKIYESLKLEAEALNAAPATYFSDFQIAGSLSLLGLDKDAQPWLDRAETLRPDNVFLLEHKARELMASGEFEGTLSVLENSNDSRSSHFILQGLSLLALNRGTDASTAFARASESAEETGRICYECLGYFAYVESNITTDAIETLISDAEKSISDGEEWAPFRVELSYLHLAKGDSAGALDRLEQAYQFGYRDWAWLEANPLLDDLKDSDRFRTIIKAMQESLASEHAKIEADPELLAFIKAVSPD